MASSKRISLNDPGVREKVLERIASRPIEYWLELLERIRNEKEGDIVLPGVPLDRITPRGRAVPKTTPPTLQPAALRQTSRAKRRSRSKAA